MRYPQRHPSGMVNGRQAEMTEKLIHLMTRIPENLRWLCERIRAVRRAAEGNSR
jgi:hypothetical protein